MILRLINVVINQRIHYDKKFDQLCVKITTSIWKEQWK
jgi:hypothetical protein